MYRPTDKVALKDPPRSRHRKIFAAAIVLIFVLWGAGSCVYLEERLAVERIQIAAKLSDITELRVKEVADWRAERLGDARTFGIAPMLRITLEGNSDTMLRSARAKYPDFLEAYRTAYGYNSIAILGPDFSPVLAAPSGTTETFDFPEELKRAIMESHTLVLHDLYRTKGGGVRMDLFAPVRSADGTKFIGAVLLRVDPATHLYNLLGQGLFDGGTWESLLIRRDGTGVRYVSTLRYRANALLNTLEPADTASTSPPTPGAENEATVTERRDYRGVPVFSVTRAVPASPWTMVTKVDQVEALAPAWRDFLTVAIGSGLALTTVGLFLGNIWQRRQREAERQRIQAEQHLGLVLQQANDAVLLIDERMRIVAANDRASAIYGYSQAALLEISLIELRAPDVTGSFWADLAKQFDGDGTVYETRNKRADGRIIDVEVSLRPLILNGKRHLVSIVRDITERIASEKRREEAEERYRIIAENTVDVIWLYDLNRDCFTFVSPGVTKLSGFTPDQVVGRSARDVLSPESASKLMERTAALVDSYKPGNTPVRSFTIELNRWHQEGGQIPIEVVGTVLTDASNRPSRVLGVSRDITERKRAMEAVETAAMLEKEREVSEMKTRFISVTSHEFRTPMAAALGSAELLANHLDRLSPAKRQEIIQRIMDSMHRMTAMLDDVLTLNRMDAKRTDTVLGEVDLRAILLGLIEEARLGDRDSHRFEIEAGAEPIPIVSDQRLLHHIISNLLANAVRYSPAGTAIKVRCQPGESAVAISIEDKGIGIPEADRARIFQPFERGSNVGQIKGTGLGLSIVKGMVELLGGSIGVEPLEGGGTRFKLSLPNKPATTT